MEAVIYSMLADLTPGQAVALQFAGAILLVAATAFVMRRLEQGRRQKTEQEFEAIKTAAQAEAGRIKAIAEAEAKTQLLSLRSQFDKETETARNELRDEEKRIAKREDLVDQKLESFNSKERMIETAQRALKEREKGLADKDKQLSDMVSQQKAQLLKVANLSMDEAREQVINKVEKEMQKETAELIQKRIEDAQDQAEEKAREIIVTSIQRYAADHTCESTVSAVDIPSDDMKGRVIGREGRNIRAFEKATGVDVIVDDTPGVVVVSAFDPVRREAARRSLEKLIQDGRIHPTRIEEVVANVQKDLQKQILEYGKQALIDSNIRSVHNKLLELIGRLHFRTSYGQNVLKHSLEVAYLAQVMAEELGLDGQLARRCGLLHDIGKAADHELEGGHPAIGADLAKRYGENDIVVNAIGGHHGDIQPTSIYTPIVSAADAISASRPGARRESLERYVQRLEKLEEIAKGFEGVKLAYAVQAGREVRVMVDAENIDDKVSAKIARDIAKRVEDELEYPGEVKVTVVREVRCVEYAR